MFNFVNKNGLQSKSEIIFEFEAKQYGQDELQQQLPQYTRWHEFYHKQLKKRYHKDHREQDSSLQEFITLVSFLKDTVFLVCRVPFSYTETISGCPCLQMFTAREKAHVLEAMKMITILIRVVVSKDLNIFKITAFKTCIQLYLSVFLL